MFEIGDEVEVEARHASNYNGKSRILTGRVVRIKNLPYYVGIEFEEYINGHDCQNSGKHGHCWNVICKNVKLIEPFQGN